MYTEDVPPVEVPARLVHTTLFDWTCRVLASTVIVMALMRLGDC